MKRMLTAFALACSFASARADTLYLTGTQTLESDLTITGANITNATIQSGTTPVTLTIAAAEGTVRPIINMTGNSYFGAASDDNLTVSLTTPVRFHCYKGGASTNRGVFRSKITGGSTDTSPYVIFSKPEAGWNYAEDVLMNAANDFKGDIDIRGIVGNDNCTMTLDLGLGSVTATDSMLGDSANEVYFSYLVAQWKSGVAPMGNMRLFINQIDSEGLKRKVHGQGIICGKKITTSFSSSDCALVLGDGFVSDPCRYLQSDRTNFETRKLETIYGNQKISGKSVTMHDNATFVYDVDIVKEVNKQDTISFGPTSAFTLNGKIIVREQQELPEGSVFEVGTVAAAAGSCTVSPSSITAGWEMSAVGDSSSGWTLRLIKSSSAPSLQVAGYSELGPTEAKVAANVVSMGSASEGTLVFYYGKADCGETSEGWDGSVAYGAVTATGSYVVSLKELEDGKYYVRPAMSTGTTTTFATDAIVFSTVPASTPSSFKWSVQEEGNFADAESWVRKTSDYARPVPGYAGDTVSFGIGGYWNNEGKVYGSNAVVRIDGTAAFGSLSASGGYGHYLRLLPAADATLLIDNLGALSVFDLDALSEFSIGSTDEPGTLSLANGVQFLRRGSYGATFNLFAKVTGGTAEAPVSIAFDSTGDEWSNLKWFVTNANNDFIGNVSVSRNKGSCMLYVGNGSVAADDAMLGNAANAVTIKSGASLVYCGTADSAPACNRRIAGNGTLAARKGSGDTQISLALGESAVIAPSDNAGTGYGSLTISAASISDTAATQYEIGVDTADTNNADKVVFSVKSELSVLGAFAISPDDASVRIKAGTRWLIGSVPAAAGAVASSRLTSASSDFRVAVEGNDTDGWSLYAESKAKGFAVSVR